MITTDHFREAKIPIERLYIRVSFAGGHLTIHYDREAKLGAALRGITMLVALFRFTFCNLALAVFILLACNCMAFAADEPSTPQEFAARYMAAYNNNDLAALQKMRYQVAGKSDMQDMIDDIAKAELSSGIHYDKFEILPAQPDGEKPMMGPDGIFYRSNLKPTNLVKLVSVTANGSSSTTVMIGQKDGIYYQVGVERSPGETPSYSFGWQRFTK